MNAELNVLRHELAIAHRELESEHRERNAYQQKYAHQLVEIALLKAEVTTLNRKLASR